MNDGITNPMFKYALEFEGVEEKGTVLVMSADGKTKYERISSLVYANDQFIAFDYGDGGAFAVYPLSSVIRIRVGSE